VKLNLKVGIFISDNTDLWLKDTSYSGFGTDLEVVTGKFYRIRSECSTHSNALDDVKVLNTTNPLSLTSSFIIFEKHLGH
jgi:hypothetical protein